MFQLQTRIARRVDTGLRWTAVVFFVAGQVYGDCGLPGRPGALSSWCRWLVSVVFREVNHALTWSADLARRTVAVLLCRPLFQSFGCRAIALFFARVRR